MGSSSVLEQVRGVWDIVDSDCSDSILSAMLLVRRTTSSVIKIGPQSMFTVYQS